MGVYINDVLAEEISANLTWNHEKQQLG